MGCGNSRESALQTVDDSVHVMLAHDRKVQKAKGEAPHGYVPRAEHPLLKPKATNSNNNNNNNPTTTEDTTTKNNNEATGTITTDQNHNCGDNTTTTTTSCSPAPATE
jgi:hypothetical protein